MFHPDVCYQSDHSAEVSAENRSLRREGLSPALRKRRPDRRSWRRERLRMKEWRHARAIRSGFSCKLFLKEDSIGNVFFAIGLFHPKKQFRGSKRDRHIINHALLDLVLRLVVSDSTSRHHKIHHYLVTYSHNILVVEEIFFYLTNCLVRQDLERLTNSINVLSRRFEQEIDIFSCSQEALMNYRHPADYNVAGPLSVKGGTERYEVALFR